MDSPATDIARRLAAPRRSAAVTCPMVAEKAATGWSAMSTIRRVAVSTSDCRQQPRAGEAQANGQTRKAATMAIFSTSSRQVAPTGPCARHLMKPANS